MSAAEYYGFNPGQDRQQHQNQEQSPAQASGQPHIDGDGQQRPQPERLQDGGGDQPSHGQQPDPQQMPYHPGPYQPGHEQQQSPLPGQQVIQPHIQASPPTQPYASPEPMKYTQEKSKQGAGGLSGPCGLTLCSCCACCTVCAGFGLLASCEECLNDMDCARRISTSLIISSTADNTKLASRVVVDEPTNISPVS